ncbi:MAG: type 2 isopentenyl-diphosphate Delta-isomerase [Pseudobdellovibrionaceae bacterium]
MDVFESRKKDHIRISLEERSQIAPSLKGLEKIRLVHEALPEFAFQDVDLSVQVLGQMLKTPLYISSMTAGHAEGQSINLKLAKAAEAQGWLMGVGSQRKELEDSSASSEWKEIRRQAPKAVLFGNLGIAEVIRSPVAQIQKLVDSLEAQGFFIHLNPLQEALQPEGHADFIGGMKAIEKVVKSLSVPVVVKEVGCGISVSTMKRLADVGVQTIDVSGLGGTHWGRIEGFRAETESWQSSVAETFKNWGMTTLECILNGNESLVPCQLWASGGVRNGLEAAKLLSLNVEMVGAAQPFLKAAVDPAESSVVRLMNVWEQELKLALFCTGHRTVAEFRDARAWEWV